MKHPFVPAILGTVFLVWPLVSADAQMGFSPSAPPMTSSCLNRGSSAAPLPTRPVQPATTVDAATGNGYAMVQQPLSNSPVDPDHKLDRGDRLSYRVQEDREDTVYPLTVTDSGEVQLPLGGRVKAAGKTPAN